MNAFRLQSAVTATFADAALGRVRNLDVGSYEAPDEEVLQFYVFTVAARRDIVRFDLDTPLAIPFGRLGELLLCDLYGAHYRIQACFTDCQEQEPGGFRHTFESQGDAEIRAPATQRHGVGGVAAALLLDALNDAGKKRG
jgi:hypothetical protein